MKRQILFLFIFIGLTASTFAEGAADSLLYKKNPNYDYELGLYKIYKKKRANIVMLGNSITHGVNWNELLGRDDVIERGIPADNLEGFLARVDFVTEVKPKICFIMGGINDIYSWTPLEQIFKSYVQLIEVLQKNNIRVVVQSTLLVAKRYTASAERNIQVEKFDTMLKDYCKTKQIEFIDLNSKLSRDKFLKDEVTHDGLHLNANGYKLWAQEVERVLFRVLP